MRGCATDSRPGFEASHGRPRFVTRINRSASNDHAGASPRAAAAQAHPAPDGRLVARCAPCSAIETYWTPSGSRRLDAPQTERCSRAWIKSWSNYPRPAAKPPAHSGRPTCPHDEKILSLYESDCVSSCAKRREPKWSSATLPGGGKSARLLLDWELFRESAPATAAAAAQRGRMEQAYGQRLQPSPRTGDLTVRQSDRLESDGIYKRSARVRRGYSSSERAPGSSSACRSASPDRRSDRHREKRLLGPTAAQQRLRPSRTDVTWTVLVHNLWVIARLPRREAKPQRAAA